MLVSFKSKKMERETQNGDGKPEKGEWKTEDEKRAVSKK